VTEADEANLRHTADFHRGRKSLFVELAQASREVWIESGDSRELTNLQWCESQIAKEEHAIQRALGVVINEGSSIDCVLDRCGDCKQDEACTCTCHTPEITDTAVREEDRE